VGKEGISKVGKKIERRQSRTENIRKVMAGSIPDAQIPHSKIKNERYVSNGAKK
jgi:hypothetical protein